MREVMAVTVAETIGSRHEKKTELESTIAGALVNGICVYLLYSGSHRAPHAPSEVRKISKRINWRKRWGDIVPSTCAFG